jgi:uncharacterized phage protein (TIGR02218 family)
MLSLSPSMQAKLDAQATTFCHCWRLARADGVVMGFTDHDRDLVFNGVNFRANTGLSASQVETNLGLSVGTAEATGALTDDGLEEGDLLNGLYDGASVETWLVDWTEIADRTLLDIATIGEVRRGEHAFSAELRSSAHYFDQPQGRAYQRSCTADLGDARCGVDLNSILFKASGVTVDFVGGVLTLELMSFFESGFFTSGALMFTSGANAGARLSIKSHIQQGLRATLSLWTTPGASIAPGETVVLTAGCDKTSASCQSKFSNIINFQGFPQMPGNDCVIAYPGSLAPTMDGGSFFR